MKKFIMLIPCLLLLAIASSPAHAQCSKPEQVATLLHEPNWFNVALEWSHVDALLSEGFEKEGIPSGWTVIDNNHDGYIWMQYPSPSNAKAYRGAGVVASLSWLPIMPSGVSVTPDDWLVTPRINLSSLSKLRFFASSQDRKTPGDHYGVYISTTGTDVADFTLLYEETLTSGNVNVNVAGQGEWYERYVDLSAYTGDVYIAFRHFNCAGRFRVNLDEVSIIPASLIGYNVYRDGVKLTSTPITNPFFLDTAPGTGTYQYGITSVWEGGCESEPALATVEMEQLPCAVSTFPFEEGFEDNAMPICWEQTQITGTNSWSVVTALTGIPATAHSGAYKARFYQSSATGGRGAKTKLILPMFDLSSISTPVLDFWHTQAIWGSGQDALRVYYKNSETAEWTLLATYLTNTPNWAEESITLPNPSATYWIAFEGEIGGGSASSYGRGVFLDDIKISDAGEIECNEPTNLAYTENNPHNFCINLTWTAAASADGVTLLGYNVYRNNVKVNTNHITSSTYLDILPNEGTFRYSITADWNNGCESDSLSTWITYVNPCANPITEEVEEYFDGQLFPPLCWQNISPDGAPWISASAGNFPTCYARSGEMAVYNSTLYNYSGKKGWLVSPLLKNTMNKLDFWMYRDNEMPEKADKINIYISPTPNPTGLTPLYTIYRNMTLSPVALTAGWNKYSIALNFGSLQEGYVIFEGMGTDGRNMYVEDIVIKPSTVPICNPPIILTTNVETSSVSLNWTAPAEGAPIGYNIFRDDILQGTVTTTVFSQENVENGTYTYCVKAVYATCESENICESVEVNGTPSICIPPENLTTILHSPDWYNVRLAWDIPNLQKEMRSGDVEIFNNGPIVTNPGQGSNGADASAMPNGGNVVGSDFTYSKNYSIADDFTLTQTTNITTIDFYGFQTYASISPSPFTAVYVRIYNGDPSNGGQIVWGDMATNVLQSSVFSGVYRTYYNNLTNTDRAIFVLKAAINTTLQAGTYWLEVSAANGSTAWAVPVATTGAGDTGNGKLNRAGTWSDFKDANLNRNLGLPFIIYGTASNMVEGYNVYRDDVKLNTNPIADHFYLDMTPAEGEYVYGVTAVWNSGCESEPVTTNVSMLVDPCADAVDLPLSESFDATDFPPFCWTLTSPTDVNWERVIANVYPSVTPHSGAGMAMYNSWQHGEGNSGLLITPRLNLAENYYTLSFWMYRDNSIGTVSTRPDRVNAYFSNAKSIEGLTPLVTVHRSTTLSPTVSSAGWYRYSVTFDASSVQSGYVILEAVSGDGNRIDIDDVQIEAAFPCDKPQLLSYTAHTPNWYNVKLNWEVPNSLSGVTVSGYNVYRNNEKLTATPITALTYTNLTSEAGTYEYGVTAVWSDGCESEKAIVTVVMDVDPCSFAITTYPFIEGFEDGSFSLCWKQEQAYGTVNWNVVAASIGTPNTAHGGNYKAYFADESDAGYRTKLVSPMFDLSVISNPELSFWHTQKNYSGDIDELRIYYKTSATGAWTLLKEFTNDIATWTKTTISLPNASSTYWIAFEGKVFWGNGIMLDDIFVDGDPLPGCSPPTALISTVTGSTVALTWASPAEGTPTGYKIFRDNELQGTVTTTVFSQENVENGTYTYCVKAVYAECESEDVCEGVIVDYVLPSYTITASAGANGAISPAGATTVTSGDSQEYTITANEGYKIKSVLIDDVAETGAVGASSYSYTFTNVIANHTIAANFEATTYSITATAGVGGSISPSGNVAVSYGSSQSFTITANTGYKIAQVLVNGQNNTAAVASGSYTFTNITANHTITANFELDVYTITASAGANGSISPIGATSVTAGDSRTFTITPSVGYKISQVLVDGVNDANAVNSGSYTFVNVTANHTISAEFEQSIFTITASAGANGSISPIGATSVTAGNNQTYTITANAGYKIKSVLVDGTAETGAVGASSYSYTFSNVTANHTISAEFEQITYTITATAGANGAISPSGTTTVTYGSNQAYTITASNDYLIKEVKIDNVPEAAAAGKTTYNYTFSNVKANHTISATFEIANPELTGITINNQPQTISSAMDYMAACGEQSVSMTLTAVGEVKVNGAAYTNGSPISLTGDKTVITITVTAGSNTATYTLTVAKALGSTTPLYIERWGATIAIVNNPANNGGYTFDQIQWYKASDNTPAGTGAYVVGNISTHYADVHAVETGAWHHTCRTKATPAPVQIVVYPNPVLAAQTLNVKLPEGLNEVNIDVYDINGKLVKQHPRVTTTLTAPTGTGIYVLKIQLPDGSITTEKIVVK